MIIYLSIQNYSFRRFPTPNFHISCINHNAGDLTPPCYSPTMGVSPAVSILSLPSVMSPQISPTDEKKLPIPNVMKSCSMSDIEYESAIYNLLSHQDPFYDRTPWFTIIGRWVIPKSKKYRKTLLIFSYFQRLCVLKQFTGSLSTCTQDGDSE